MRRGLAIAGGAMVAAVATHGIVYAGMHLGTPQPLWTYRGFFDHAWLALWGLWSRTHGWEAGLAAASARHLEELGRLVAPAVLLACPLLGFGVFRVSSGHRAGRHWWKPLAIAIALPLGDWIRLALKFAGLDEATAEAVRSAVVVLLMVWNAGGIGIPAPMRSSDPQPRPAAA